MGYWEWHGLFKKIRQVEYLKNGTHREMFKIEAEAWKWDLKGNKMLEKQDVDDELKVSKKSA